MVDAVARTLFRLFIRRRNLLEWTTAAQVSDDLTFDQRKLFTQISASLTFGAFVAALMYYWASKPGFWRRHLQHYGCYRP